MLDPAKPFDFRPVQTLGTEEWLKRIRESNARESLRRPWVEAVKNLDLIKLCRSTPATKRKLTVSGSFSWCGYVYLMRDPKNGEHKIGRTDKIHRRRRQIERQLSRAIDVAVVYRTPVSQRLEKYLHRHFHRFHAWNEWFNLPAAEVEGFAAVAAKIERHLLAIENLRWEAEVEWRNAAFIEKYPPASDR